MRSDGTYKMSLRLDDAAKLFRAMNGDKAAQAEVTIEQVTSMIPAETFEEFLEVNQIETFEKVVR